jgi:hypothetical protein
LRLTALLGLVFAFAALESAALADVPVVPHVTVDEIAVRYFAPDSGGAARPRFITSRQLAFEARLLALEEEGGVAPASLQTRHLRTAVEAHVAEDMLATLPSEEPDVQALTRVQAILRSALEQRVGGKANLDRAAKLDAIGEHEVDAILRRQARAALYVDRATPILTFTEDQLRETYRTTSNPFRGQRFDDCKEELSHWLVVERLRSAEQAYMQTARSRLTILYP